VANSNTFVTSYRQSPINYVTHTRWVVSGQENSLRTVTRGGDTCSSLCLL